VQGREALLGYFNREETVKDFKSVLDNYPDMDPRTANRLDEIAREKEEILWEMQHEHEGGVDRELERQMDRLDDEEERLFAFVV
jgi:hypothetical protein